MTSRYNHLRHLLAKIGKIKTSKSQVVMPSNKTRQWEQKNMSHKKWQSHKSYCHAEPWSRFILSSKKLTLWFTFLIVNQSHQQQLYEEQLSKLKRATSEDNFNGAPWDSRLLYKYEGSNSVLNSLSSINTNASERTLDLRVSFDGHGQLLNCF